MTIEMARSFFLWCTVINYGVLLWWAVLYRFARNGLLRVWRQWIRVSDDQFDLINLAGMTAYKIGVILFNLVPCIVFYIVR